MQFITMGAENGPVIVLMGWPFSTPEVLKPVAEQLGDARVILPCWDGEDGGKIPYTTRRDQAAQILAWLKGNGITRVDVLASISLGAATALDLADLILADGKLTLGRVLCDSGTFARRNLLTRFIRNCIVRHLFRKARDGSEEEAVAALLQSRMVALLTGKDTTLFRPVLTDMVHVARSISNKSTRAQQLACCSFDWPEFPEQVVRRIVFIWSSNDPARHAVRQLRKHYPYAIYQPMGRLGHGGMAIQDPKGYASLLRGLIPQ